MKVWTAEQANAWYETVDWQVGFNYLPASAVNSMEMWQEDTFDEAAIRRELALAASVGYNSIRVFLPFLVWEIEGEGFLQRFEMLLRIADQNHMSVLPIFFDDCAFDQGKDPVYGKQPDPIPGIHNGRWVPSPGFAIADHADRQGALRAYVQAVVGAHREDNRILAWDLFNEPGNSSRNYESLPLLVNSFRWARECEPTQPLTAAPWLSHLRDSVTLACLELSDVISFHSYEALPGTQAFVSYLAQQNKPLFVTEWLCRVLDNTFFSHLPYFAEKKISCWHWGCMVGRTQTNLVNGRCDPHPTIWQHDVFDSDGTPYDPAEFALLQKCRAMLSQA